MYSYESWNSRENFLSKTAETVHIYTCIYLSKIRNMVGFTDWPKLCFHIPLQANRHPTNPIKLIKQSLDKNNPLTQECTTDSTLGQHPTFQVLIQSSHCPTQKNNRSQFSPLPLQIPYSSKCMLIPEITRNILIRQSWCMRYDTVRSRGLRESDLWHSPGAFSFKTVYYY